MEQFYIAGPTDHDSLDEVFLMKRFPSGKEKMLFTFWPDKKDICENLEEGTFYKEKLLEALLVADFLNSEECTPRLRGPFLASVREMDRVVWKEFVKILATDD